MMAASRAAAAASRAGCCRAPAAAAAAAASASSSAASTGGGGVGNGRAAPTSPATLGRRAAGPPPPPPLWLCRHAKGFGSSSSSTAKRAPKPAAPTTTAPAAAPAARTPGRAPPVAPGRVSPRRPVPAGIGRPPYADTGKLPPLNRNLELHDAQGVARMRAAGRLAAAVLDRAAELVVPGATTEEVDAALHAMIVAAGAYPSPLNYGGFPKSVCTSVNDVICHGIPDDRALLRGDIVNVDVTVFLDGHHGDTSRMFFAGGEAAAPPEARALCAATKRALDAAIAVCAPGVPYARIGDAISDVADAHGYGVVKDFIGHGVGRVFHAAPQVLHYRNREPGRMQLGSTFTIEPMLVESKDLRSRFWKDGWTATTVDGSLSAQYEHTLLVVEGGVEVLTKSLRS